jgi:non-ribosomal peptide synthetase component F
MHQAILAQARRNRERPAACKLRFVRSASAPLPPRILAELEGTFETSVIESYGMTETTSSPIACNPLPPRQRKPGSVGVPVGLEVAIMDEGGVLLPGGKTGQVVVRGASVMAGYYGDPVVTVDAFAGNWFKTGDLGFFDNDGYLFLVGRLREIINRGGEKIAPQEVDDVLGEHPAVAEVVTFSVDHATLGEDVASAVVLRSHCVATPKEIRQFAVGRIADFKVPRQLLIVKEIPKGPSGKVQRTGLAAKLGLVPSATPSPAFAAPRTALEKTLAKYWAEILQVEQVGIHDDFFACGGDSLLATRVICHVYDITQVELQVSQFFQAPTVAEVAHQIERLTDVGRTSRPSSAIVSVPRKNGVMPASVAQERLYKLQHALPELPYFNVLYALRLTPPCELAILERSINEIVRRHEVLRTTFALIDGQCVEVIAPRLTVTLPFDDLRTLPPSQKEAVGHQLIQDEALHSFDLVKGPLLRARLIQLSQQEQLLLISAHQVVCDGWSLGVLTKELAVLYNAFFTREEPALPPLPFQYADFAYWQRHWKSHAEIAAQLTFWREQLREPLPAIQLATSGARDGPDDFQTARRTRVLPASLARAAKCFSSREGGTLFVALVAALKTLLHCRLGENDLRVATNVANRNRPGTKALIGPLVNTIIIRTNLAGDPSSLEVLRRVRATVLASFAHQDLPFEQLTEVLERERHIKPASHAKVLILLQNSTLRPPARSGTFVCEEANPNLILPLVTITTFDVIVGLSETSNGLAATCIYKSHLLGLEAIDRLLRDFEMTIEQMVMYPERPISAIRTFLEQEPASGLPHRQY